jgi:hypothetical protein
MRFVKQTEVCVDKLEYQLLKVNTNNTVTYNSYFICIFTTFIFFMQFNLLEIISTLLLL